MSPIRPRVKAVAQCLPGTMHQQFDGSLTPM